MTIQRLKKALVILVTIMLITSMTPFGVFISSAASGSDDQAAGRDSSYQGSEDGSSNEDAGSGGGSQGLRAANDDGSGSDGQSSDEDDGNQPLNRGDDDQDAGSGNDNNDGGSGSDSQDADQMPEDRDADQLLKDQGDDSGGPLRGNPIDYVDAKDNPKTQADCNKYDGSSLLNGGWYYLDGDEEATEGCVIKGDVNFILLDGSESVFNKSISISANSTLTIWHQNGQSGKLTVKGTDGEAGIYVDKTSTLTINGGFIDAEGSNEAAGIGGDSYSRGSDAGTIIINNGNVNATSGRDGAGIGGGYRGSLGRLDVTGGTVMAIVKEGNGAGIGGGSLSKQGGAVNISGGTVIADVRETRLGMGGYGAGIGGGSGSNGGDVNISGDTTRVEARSIHGAGIGGGGSPNLYNLGGKGGKVTIEGKSLVKAVSKIDGAGIGGGYRGDGGTVKILSGGEVIAEGGCDDSSQAIGHGWVFLKYGSDSGSLTLYDDAEVTYGDVTNRDHNINRKGVTTGSDRVDKCRENSYVRIAPMSWDGKITIEKKWKDGSGNDLSNDKTPDEITVEIQHYGPIPGQDDERHWVKMDSVTLFKNDNWKKEDIDVRHIYNIDDQNIQNWRIRELTEAEDAVDQKIVHDDEDKDKEEGEATNAVQYTVNEEKTDFIVDYDFYTERGKGMAVITNSHPALTVEKKWTKPGENEGDDDQELTEDLPDSIKVILQHKDENEWKTMGEPKELSASNGWKTGFPLVDGYDEIADYRIRELDADGDTVYDKGDADKPGSDDDASDDPDPTATYKTKDGEDEKENVYKVSYEVNDGKTVITNKLDTSKISLEIEKEWDIDIEKKDRPDSIQMVIQKKDGDEWKTDQVVNVKAEND